MSARDSRLTRCSALSAREREPTARSSTSSSDSTTISLLEALKFEKFPEGHPRAGQEKYAHDAEHRKKVDALYKKMYPGEDRHEV